MRGFTSTKAWADYKRDYTSIDEADTTARLEALEDKILDRTGALAEALSDHPDLARTLGELLNERIKSRHRALQKTNRHGRSPRPDWSAELQRFVRRLDAEDRALAGLSAVAAGDPFLEGTLKPAVERSIAVVESRMASLARVEPDAPLLAEAKAVVDRARARRPPAGSP